MLTVDGSSARREDDPIYAGSARSFQQVDRAENVDRGVEQWIVDGLHHRDLRGKMENHIRGELLDNRSKLDIPDVGLMKLDPAVRSRFGQVVQVTGREIINNQHLPAFVHQPAREVRTDEPCAAGDEGPAVQRRMLVAGTKRYFTRAHKAGNPSRQEIFLPSSTSRPV